MAKQFISTMSTTSEIVADFYEQESSSLKLLLSAICAEKAEFWPGDDFKGAAIWIHHGTDAADSYPVELDSSGIPVLTPEIVEALKTAV